MDTLLDETLAALRDAGKTPVDVLWVGIKGKCCDWAQFATMANFSYSNSYGTSYIASDLVVVGDRWWLERGEYDGAEWWDFKRRPDRPEHNGLEYLDLWENRSPCEL